jgi:hypothetical protein
LSVSTVFSAISAARVTRDPDGLLDPERADREWSERTRQRSDSPPLPAPASGTVAPRPMSYAEARAERARVEAMRARLRFDRENGTLVVAQAVADRLFEITRAVRDHLLTVAPRLAGMLEGLDLREREAVINAEMRDVCADFARIAGVPAEVPTAEGRSRPTSRN